jgi:hypothetical protein
LESLEANNNADLDCLSELVLSAYNTTSFGCLGGFRTQPFVKNTLNRSLNLPARLLAIIPPVKGSSYFVSVWWMCAITASEVLLGKYGGGLISEEKPSVA